MFTTIVNTIKDIARAYIKVARKVASVAYLICSSIIDIIAALFESDRDRIKAEANNLLLVTTDMKATVIACSLLLGCTTLALCVFIVAPVVNKVFSGLDGRKKKSSKK